MFRVLKFFKNFILLFIKKLAVLILTLLVIGSLLKFIVPEYIEQKKYVHYLSFIPDKFNVSEITYMKDSGFSIGPGGNESGLILYQLPKEISQKINEEGLDYLDKASLKYIQDGIEYYSEWFQTPMGGSRDWSDYYIGKNDDYDFTQNQPKIQNFLCRYATCINVDSKITNTINNSLLESGNYYTYVRNGRVMLIIPKENLIVVAFTG